MRSYLFVIPILLAVSFVQLSCADKKIPEPTSWRTWNDDHKHMCEVNDLSYWNEIIRNCFPESLGNKKLDRFYAEDMGKDEDPFPVEVTILFSRLGAQQWRNDASKGVDIKRHSIGEFECYTGRVAAGTVKGTWAFLDEYLCIMHPFKDLPYKIQNNDLFIELLESLDAECIRDTLPNF